MIDCLIIGAGPAGLTAAIYLQRFHRSFCIVDANQSRAKKIPLSRNYPGFPNGINGNELLLLLKQQLENFGGSIVPGTVTRLQKNAESHFTADLADQQVLARTVLLATGVVDVEPPLAGYERLKSTALVRFCPICDGFEFTDDRIGVIGNDAHGLRECDFIRHFSKTVTYINLSADLPKTEPGASCSAMLDGRGSRVHYEATGKHIDLELADGSLHQFDVLYCALGCNVRSSLAINLGALSDAQQCLVVNEHLETTVKGLFAAGDVVSSLHQLAVATGQAAIAATAIHNRLRAP